MTAEELKMDKFEIKAIEAADALKEESLDFLRQLIKTPSPTCEEGAAQELVKNFLSDMGLEVEVFEASLEAIKGHPEFSPYEPSLERGFKGRPNIIARMRGSGGGKSLLFFGHIDTVPPGPREDWLYDPYGGEIDGGRIYGRGTMDMKGGLAAFIMAMKALQKSGARLGGDIIAMTNIEEEVGGSGGILACIVRGIEADGCVYVHPGIGRDKFVLVSSSGVLFFKIVVKGKLEHGYQSHLGVNAIEKCMKLYRSLKELDDYRGVTVRSELVEKNFYLSNRPPRATNLFVSSISGGEWDYQVPSRCEMKCALTFPYGETVDGVKSAVEKCIEASADSDPWLAEHRPALQWTGFVSPSMTDPDHPLVALAMDSMEDILGVRPQISALPVGSDIRFPIIYAGIPTIAIGPAGGNGHGANEWADIGSYLQSVKTLALLALRWCRGD